jgi:hypothetical protein
MVSRLSSFKRKWIVGASAILLGLALCWGLLAQSGSPSNPEVLVRGAGTTVLEGGTGSPDFVPVMTQIAFHVERIDGAIIGNFECLALAPPASSGPSSGAFTTNVMYVTGTVQGLAIEGDTIRISGGSDCTGLGAGSNVPFSCVIKKGGPGATVVLTAGANQQVFRETLLNGSFEILGQLSTNASTKALSSLFLPLWQQSLQWPRQRR